MSLDEFLSTSKQQRGSSKRMKWQQQQHQATAGVRQAQAPQQMQQLQQQRLLERQLRKQFMSSKVRQPLTQQLT